MKAEVRAVSRRARRLALEFLARPGVRRNVQKVTTRFPAVLTVGRTILGVPQTSGGGSAARRRIPRVRPGRFFTDGRGEKLPIVAFVAIGLNPGDAEVLAGAVEGAQVTTAGFRPLMIIDTGEFAPFRARGYVAEHVMPADRYALVNPHDAYSEYLLDRVSAIVKGYGVKSVVPLPPGNPDVIPAYLLRLVGTLNG